MSTRHHNEPEAAAGLASEALDIGRPQGDSVELGYALMLRAHVHSSAQEHEAATRLYLEALGVRERMNNTSGMLAAHLSLARLLVERDRSAEAKSHLDRALALVPQAGSHSSDKQFTKAGFGLGAMPRGAARRMERARLALSDDLAQQLMNTGGVLDYEQSLQRVEVFLNESYDARSA